MKEAAKRGGLYANAQLAKDATKVLDEPPDPAVIVLPLFQSGIFLSVIVKYLLVMM